VHFSTRAFANPAEPRLLEVIRFIEAFVAVGHSGSSPCLRDSSPSYA
jgi:hypothetical protein